MADIWKTTEADTLPDPMEQFGKWLERHPAENPQDDREAVELVPVWSNEVEGERLTGILPEVNE